MTSSERIARSLYGILRQERANGFDDSAVIGGLDAFLKRSSADLGRVLDEIPAYDAMTPSERSEWADSAVGHIRKHLTNNERTRTKSMPESSAPPAQSSPKPRPRRRSPLTPLKISDGVTAIKGVWKKNLSRLESIGVHTVGDLIRLFPARHNDFSSIRTVAELVPGDNQTAILTVWEASETMLGRQRSTQAVLGDETGNIRAVWFNNPWLASQLKPGAKVMLSGKVSVFMGNPVFQGPEHEVLENAEHGVHTGRLVPVYPSTQGLSQRVLRTLVKTALDSCLDQLEEFLPEAVLHRSGLIGRVHAVQQMHYPDDWDAFRAARRRLAFDELFLLQLSVVRRRLEWKERGGGVPLSYDASALGSFLDSLPFELTRAQLQSVQDVLTDVRSDSAMNRLLQGDVGSGKTVVAVIAMLAAVDSGRQAAFMAPTEVLAEQHYLTVCTLLGGDMSDLAAGNIQRIKVAGLDAPLVIALLLGGHRKRAKDDLHSLMSAGMIDVVIGTHALIQGPVDIPNLALAVVDEQHRFGVLQRAALRGKGERPHMLAMSATPIPRSLALAIHGDLDVSVIDELPPGRRTIRTRFVDEERRDAAYAFVRKEVEAGRQAFVVCPLIDESEVIQTRAAQEEYKRLSTEVYPDISVDLLHGRMSLQKKQQVMDGFKDGATDILVSTPVVEVGIDVPNATVMLIDGAERFGLSQLHQFRGRVGRGSHQSHCLLLSESPGSEALKRLKLLERISDGFSLAEEDLKLRGPGDYLGTRQSGLPPFRVAQITDQDILSVAHREARRLLSEDPDLSRAEHRPLARAFEEYWERSITEIS